MNETFEPQQNPQQSSPEKVGAYLRRAREARGLTVDAVARGLKLSPKYIESLEADRFTDFTAQPYIRVYLKAVAGHLGLDPSEVLKMYRHQQGLDDTDPERESSGRIEISSAKPDKSSTPPWPAIFGLIAVLAVIAIIAQRMNPSAPSTSPATTLPADSVSAAGVDSVDSISQPALDSVQPELPTAQPAIAPARDTLKLTIAARKDSSWSQVFADGVRWDGFVYAGRTRTFTALDSFNIQTGHNANCVYTLNSKPVTPPAAKSVAFFKLDRNGTSEWTQNQWLKAFKGRL